LERLAPEARPEGIAGEGAADLPRFEGGGPGDRVAGGRIGRKDFEEARGRADRPLYSFHPRSPVRNVFSIAATIGSGQSDLKEKPARSRPRHIRAHDRVIATSTLGKRLLFPLRGDLFSA